MTSNTIGPFSNPELEWVCPSSEPSRIVARILHVELGYLSLSIVCHVLECRVKSPKLEMVAQVRVLEEALCALKDALSSRETKLYVGVVRKSLSVESLGSEAEG